MAGLEVLFSSVQSQLKGREDVLLCSLHWCVISQGLKCIGIGESIPGDLKDRRKSELLPAGWNESSDGYSLLYIDANTNCVFLLKILRLDGNLLVNFTRLENGTTRDITLDVSHFTSGDHTSFDSAYNNLEELQFRFLSEVLEPVLKERQSVRSPLLVGEPSQPMGPSQSTQHCRDPLREDNPLRIPPLRPYGGRNPPDWAEPDDPFSIGRGDLDPLAAGRGGGMMFDPMRFHRPHRGFDPSAGLPGRLPPGAVPPGARFDPFGPDLTGTGNPRGGRPGPDPDHLPPPGYNDMFM